MIDWSLIVAVLVVSLLGGAVTGAVSLAIGGMGVLRGLGQRIADIESTTERTNERITREVKTRAGDTATQKRTDATVKAEAEALLASTPTTGSKRPSVLGRTH